MDPELAQMRLLNLLTQVGPGGRVVVGKLTQEQMEKRWSLSPRCLLLDQSFEGPPIMCCQGLPSLLAPGVAVRCCQHCGQPSLRRPVFVEFMRQADVKSSQIGRAHV